MRRFVASVLIAIAPALRAQVPGDARPPAESGEARQLREQIRQRWREHVRTALALSDEQGQRLDATERRFEEQRLPIRTRQREINQALSAELASSAPNEDRVKGLIAEQQQNQARLQQVNRDEDREMQGYLTPVQRARYHNERRRFQEQVAEVVRHHREQRPAPPPPRPRVQQRPPKRGRP
ncbi:MAG TPA: hypothetical protein VM736_16405 [Gemmatimonadales bacterium]|nr:hypothetical protein [Gemmatimonadales bacterium]